MRLPDFLVVGAQRSGTTWIDGLLRSHSDVYLPERRKEVHFFDQYYERGVDWYCGFFADAPIGASCVGEVTPKYLFDREVPGRIHATLGDIKLIACLREPVSRAFSQYGLEQIQHGFAGSFQTFLEERPEAIERGLYAQQLERYLNYWDRDQILVLVFEELMAGTVDAATMFGDFLDVDRNGFDTTLAPAGRSYVPRARRTRAVLHRVAGRLREADRDWVVDAGKRLGMSRIFESPQGIGAPTASERESLAAAFEADRERLEGLLGRDLRLWEPERIGGTV